MTLNNTPKRALLIFNPKSGKGESPLPQFISELGARGWRVDASELSPEVDIATLLSSAKSYQVVVAAGGDGTVSSVAYQLKYSNVPLLAYPAGTANLIAQNLDLPEDPAALAQVVDDLNTVRVDLGELSVEREGGTKHGFALLAGAGADATMIKDSEELKGKFGVMAYVVSAMKQISPKSTTFKLELDGDHREVEAIAVMVANFGMANYRLPIASDISPSDGKFTVVVLKAGNLLQLLPHLIDSVRSRFNLGDPVFGKNMDTFEAKQVRIASAEPFPLQYDGELHEETTPFSAKVLPGAIRFLTPIAKVDLDT